MPNRAAEIRQALEADGYSVTRRDPHAITATKPDGTKKGRISIRRLHTDTGTEIDTDWIADGADSRTRPGQSLIEMWVRSDGTYRFTPRPEFPNEYIEFGELEYWRETPPKWATLPRGVFQRNKNNLTWTGPDYEISQSALPGRVKFTIRIDSDPGWIRPVRWSYTLNNLTFGIGDDALKLYGLDGQYAGELDVPRWWDSSHRPMSWGAIPYTLDATHFTITPPDLSSAVFPVYIDPTSSVGESGDDGNITTQGPTWFQATNGVYLGQNSSNYYYSIWLRFPTCNIDQYAQISSAYLNLDPVYQPYSGYYVYFDIYAIDEDDHVAPNNYSQWSSDHSSHASGGSTGNAVQTYFSDPWTSDTIGSAVEYVVNRAGWTYGNAIGIHIDDTGSQVNGYLAFASYQHPTGTPPELEWTVLSGDATATPASITLTTTMPAPTASGSATATPSTVTPTLTVPAPTASGSSTAEPASVTLTTVMPAPSFSSAANPAPASMALTTVMPSPDMSVGSTVEPASLTLATVMPAPTVFTGINIEPSPIALSVTIPTPDTSVGSNIPATTIALTVTMPAPTASAGSTAAPAAIDLTTVIPAPTFTSSVDAQPATVVPTVTIPTPDTSVGSTVAASTIALAVTMPAPTFSSSVTATPATITPTMVLPSPSISTGSTAAPSAMALSVTIPAVSVLAGQSIEATPAAIALTTVLPSPTVATGMTATPATIALSVTIPRPYVGLLPVIRDTVDINLLVQSEIPTARLVRDDIEVA